MGRGTLLGLGEQGRGATPVLMAAGAWCLAEQPPLERDGAQEHLCLHRAPGC